MKAYHSIHCIVNYIFNFNMQLDLPSFLSCLMKKSRDEENIEVFYIYKSDKPCGKQISTRKSVTLRRSTRISFFYACSLFSSVASLTLRRREVIAKPLKMLNLQQASLPLFFPLCYILFSRVTNPHKGKNKEIITQYEQDMKKTD